MITFSFLAATRLISIVSKPIKIVVVIVVYVKEFRSKCVWSKNLSPENPGQKKFLPKKMWVQILWAQKSIAQKI